MTAFDGSNTMGADAYRISVLDYGYVKSIDGWGSDESIIEAARMSTAKGFQGWDRDAGLLSYLWKHKHHTPFEMGGSIIEVQAPIFVVREWMRHRTQSFNELSARYVELPDLYYIPSIERLMHGRQSTRNKQSSDEGFTEAAASILQSNFEQATKESRVTYEYLIEQGVARELARLVIPMNQYTRFRASANLRNWLHFLGLRLDESAQWEIREFSKALSIIIRGRFPRTYALFEETR